MKKINTLYLSGIIYALTGLVLLSSPVFAATPSLSLYTTGSGDDVQINVNGDASASVILFYSKTGVGLQTSVLGSTNTSGTFSTTISSSGYGITANTPVYVRTGGINGIQSQQVMWPYYNSSTSNNNSLTLDPSALLINIGQSATTTASTSYLFLQSNTNPSIANINLNGSQISVSANTYGSTVATICAVGTSNCATLSITVQSSASQQLTFSQNNFTIYSGQSADVTVSGGTGTYVITNNSNSNYISASINGSSIHLTAGTSNGNSSITICSSSGSYCGILNVNSSSVNSTAISFSQSNPYVQLGQNTTVTIYGGTGTNFYVSSNSNPSIVQANISGNVLTLIGNTSGSSNVNICSYGGTCAQLTANVGYSSVSNGSISLSQTSISIVAGQSSSVTIYGGSAPYNVSTSSSNIFSSNISGNILTIYGINSGTASANVCSSSGCATLSITINGTNNSTAISFSQNNVNMSVGQQQTIYITGSGSYYVSNNTSPNVATANVTNSVVILTASNTGSTSITICQNSGQCSVLYVNVGNTSQNVYVTVSPLSVTAIPGSLAIFNASATGFTSPFFSLSDSFPGTSLNSSSINSSGYFSWRPVASDVGSHTITVYVSDSYGHSANTTVNITVGTDYTIMSQGYVFERYLGYGDNGSDVLELQKLLKKLGYLSANPNGHYGPATTAAVKALQKANGINQVGAVGPSTKNLINKLSSTGSGSSTSTSDSAKQQQIQSLLQQIQSLQQLMSSMQ